MSTYVAGREVDLVQNGTKLNGDPSVVERQVGEVHALIAGSADGKGFGRSVCDRTVQLTAPTEWPVRESMSVGTCRTCIDRTT